MNSPHALQPDTVAIKPPSLIHGVILGAFCLGFGLLLALTYRHTRDDIAARALEDRQNSLRQVIPADIHDNDPVTDTLQMTDAQARPVTIYRARRNGRVTGLAYEISGPGYSGEIRLVMGIAADGSLLGVRVLAHKETPGLGDKIEARKSDWILGFNGLSLANTAADLWKVKKDGGRFDQFAGATITPRAVVLAVRRGLEFFATNRTRLTAED
ncbi:MAG: electron transport complex subunit RsxG [Pseudomonadota bacterium]